MSPDVFETVLSETNIDLFVRKWLSTISEQFDEISAQFGTMLGSDFNLDKFLRDAGLEIASESWENGI